MRVGAGVRELGLLCEGLFGRHVRRMFQKVCPSSGLPFNKSLLGALPPEILHKIFLELNLNGPQLEIIEHQATVEQENKVIIGDIYHLIIDAGIEELPRYFLGFSKKDTNGCVVYVKQALDQKSAFYRLITQDPDLISCIKNISLPDRFTLHYLEEAIQKEGGIIRPRLCERIYLACVCKDLRKWMEPEQAEYSLEFSKTIVDEIFQDLLFYIALGEQGKVELILKHFPEFLLSRYKGDVLSISQHFIFHDATAFKLAVWNHDSFMYKAMLNYIPAHAREAFSSDLLSQHDDLEMNGVFHTLKLLGACGLRVLESAFNEPTKEHKKGACNGAAYHLILHRDAQNQIVDADLGFRDAITGRYLQHPLPEGELKEFVLNQKNEQHFQVRPLRLPSVAAITHYPHLIIRDKRILRFAEKDIKRLGGQAELQTNKPLKAYIDQLSIVCKKYVRAFNAGYSEAELIERWCVAFGQLQRVCFVSPLLAELWMFYGSGGLSEQSFKEVRRPPQAIFDGDVLLFPFDSFFAAEYASGLIPRRPQPNFVWSEPSFFKIFLSNTEREREVVKQQLSQNAQQFPRASWSCAVI